MQNKIDSDRNFVNIGGMFNHTANWGSAWNYLQIIMFGFALSFLVIIASVVSSIPARTLYSLLSKYHIYPSPLTFNRATTLSIVIAVYSVLNTTMDDVLLCTWGHFTTYTKFEYFMWILMYDNIKNICKLFLLITCGYRKLV